jgi:hypothetical protein
MTLKMIARPIYAVTCDADGCAAEVRDDAEWATRASARNEGWQLRPARGKGSRTAPDFCPAHRTEGGTR